MKLHLDPQFALRQATLEKSQKPAGNPTDLEAKCQEFEAIFIQQMFKEMRATIPDGGLVERGMEQDIYEEMMDAEAAKALAYGRGIGIAQALYGQLQELEQDPEAKGSED